jgi:hypothetical protein
MGGHTIAIKTPAGDLLGFLMLATDDPVGDCIVMPLPARADLFQSPAGAALVSDGHVEAGELRFARSATELTVAAPAPIRLEVLPAGDFVGQVGPHPIRAEWANKRA